MVKKGSLMDKFDAIRVHEIMNRELIVGAAEDIYDLEIELYDKNLILTQGWDMLPVLEKIDVCPNNHRLWLYHMTQPAFVNLTIILEIYNCEQDDIDEDHLIGQAYMSLCQQTGFVNVVALHGMVNNDYNIPLRNKITLRLITGANANALVNPMAAGVVGFRIFLNIDYVKYSQQELKDWIIKETFIDQ
jgi:hypothetical protein